MKNLLLLVVALGIIAPLAPARAQETDAPSVRHHYGSATRAQGDDGPLVRRTGETFEWITSNAN